MLTSVIALGTMTRIGLVGEEELTPSETKVHSRSLCTWENHNNFRITGSIYKIHGPERSPGPSRSFDILILAIGPHHRKLAVLP